MAEGPYLWEEALRNIIGTQIQFTDKRNEPSAKQFTFKTKKERSDTAEGKRSDAAKEKRSSDAAKEKRSSDAAKEKRSSDAAKERRSSDAAKEKRSDAAKGKQGACLGSFSVPLNADMVDLEYPVSMHSITLDFHKFPISEIYEQMAKKHAFRYEAVDSTFTKFVLSYDLQIFEENKIERAEVPQDAKDLRSLKSLVSGRAKLSEIWLFDEITITGFFDQFHPCCSLNIVGEIAPIFLLTGRDDLVVEPRSPNMPPLVIHENSVIDIQNQLEDLQEDVQFLSKKLRDSEIRDPILYYWSNRMINAGYVYWLLKGDETFYLYDLTSSFRMEPFVSADASDELDYEKNAIRNAVALLYFHCAKSSYLRNERASYSIIMALLRRAIHMLDPNLYPVEWCLANIISAEMFIPRDIDICKPILPYTNLGIPGEKPKRVETNDSRVLLRAEILKSLQHLSPSFKLLADRLEERGILPLVDNIMPRGSSALSYHLDRFVEDILDKRFDIVSEEVYAERVFEPFIKNNELELRMMVFVIRQIYLNFLLHARMFRKFGVFSFSLAYIEPALKAWIAMASILSPKKELPLPLRPLYMIGEIFYRFSKSKEYAEDQIAKYRKTETEHLIRVLESITTTLDNRCFISFSEKTSTAEYAKVSIEYFARAFLYTNLKPSEHLVKRICIVTNDLVYTYLKEYAENPTCTSLGDPKINFTSCLRLMNLAARYSRTLSDGTIPLITCLNKGKYIKLEACVSLGEGKAIKHACSPYIKAIAAFEEGIKFAKKPGHELELAKDLAANEYAEAVLEYIWKLKEMEEEERRSYHDEILPLCRSYYTHYLGRYARSIEHEPYFQYKVAMARSLMAEYLYGLYKDLRPTDVDKKELINSVEFWFLGADDQFRHLPKFNLIEIGKTNLDLITFYYTLIEEEHGDVLDYHRKILQQLVMCLPHLISYVEANVHEGNSAMANQKERWVNYVISCLYSQTRKALLKRLTMSVANNTRIDLPHDVLHDLCMNSMADTSNAEEVFSKLKLTLGDVQVLLQ